MITFKKLGALIAAAALWPFLTLFVGRALYLNLIAFERLIGFTPRDSATGVEAATAGILGFLVVTIALVVMLMRGFGVKL